MESSKSNLDNFHSLIFMGHLEFQNGRHPKIVFVNISTHKSCRVLILVSIPRFSGS